MTNEIKISVIVPAYNVEKYFSRCIESIINQTHRNIEIIVINDGSTDNTGEILNRYAMLDERIIAIHQKNIGLIDVREKGIKLASGQYIGFVDGDDEIEPYMYERLLNNALKYSADISQCGILYCFYDGRKKQMHGTNNTYIFSRIEGYRELMNGTLVEPSLCNKLYKKELLLDSCLDKNILNNEDLLRNAVLFSRAQKSVFEDFCGYHYWRRAGSMSNNIQTIQNGIHILNARKLIIDNASPDLMNYAIQCYLSGILNVYNSLIGNNSPIAKNIKKKCKKELFKQKAKFIHLSKNQCFRIYLVLFFSPIYNKLYLIHLKFLHAKIKNQTKKINQ